MILSCLALLLIMIYLPGLSGPFLHDDFVFIVPLLERSDAVLYANILTDSGPLGRPVSVLSLLVNIELFGRSTMSLKAISLMFHVINFLLVFLIARILFQKAKLSVRSSGFWAFATVVIWAFHPLHVSTVLYVMQRKAELSALFCIAGLLVYILGRCRQLDERRAGTLLVTLAFVLFIPLAAFSKENGVLLPVYYLLAEWIFFKGQGKSAEQLWLKVFFVSFLVLPSLIAGLYYLIHFQEKIIEGNLNYGFHFYERLLTQSRVLMQFISFTVLPDISSMSFYYDNFSISTGLFTPVNTLFSVLLLGSLFLLALKLRNTLPLFSFGILFFFGAHLVESTIYPLQIMYEHRQYLPSLGLILALMDAIRFLCLRLTGRLPWLGVVILIFPMTLGTSCPGLDR